MKIKIETLSDIDDVMKVRFSSEYGNSCAQWIGDPPVIGKNYDVELDVCDDLIWGENIFLSEGYKHQVSVEGNDLVFVGSLISVEEDGCIAVSLGDSIILLDVINAPLDISGLVEFHAPNVNLYPINL